MRTFTHLYSSKDELINFITKYNLLNHENLLIQVFSGNLNKTFLQELTKTVKSILPQSVLIGATTAGEIYKGEILQGQVLINITLFEKTTLKASYVSKTSYVEGEALAKNILIPKTKACILFTEGLHSSSETFLEGFSSFSKEVIVAGGNAADNGNFHKTYLLYEDQVLEEGAVGVSLNNEALIVNNSYALNWSPIGKELTVTKAEGNIIYELDHKPITEVFEYYLGKEVLEGLPESAIEFPLIKEQEGLHIARALVGVKETAFQYAASFNVGDKVRFGIGNANDLISTAQKVHKRLSTIACESIFIYSCIARKSFFQDDLQTEFKMINDVYPCSGFFTYGEYFHREKPAFLNITTTLLTLSETPDAKPVCAPQEKHTASRTLNALSNLVNVTSQELLNSNSILKQYEAAIDNSSIVTKTDVNGHITYVNDSFCKISGFSKEELLGDKHVLVRHEDVPSKLYENLWSTILARKIWKGILKNKNRQGDSFYVDISIIPILDKRGDIKEFIGVANDVSKLIKQEQIIYEQSIDALTGLFNRPALMKELSKKADQSLAVIDINHFRAINNLFGVEFGDELIRSIADFLTMVFHKEHVQLFRFGADEFAILFPNLQSDETLYDIGTALVKRIKVHNFHVAKEVIPVNVTMGIASNSTHLLADAEQAIEKAREDKREILIYKESRIRQKQMEDNFLWLYRTKNALSDNRIVSFYQPIVCLKTGKQHFESLVRLIDEDNKIYSPFYFLDIAKRSGYYPDISKRVIDAAFVKAHQGFEISINLTADDISDEKTMAYLYEKLSFAKELSSKLTIEITESEAIEDFDLLKRFIYDMKERGCKIAIDDFGSGYSNFINITKIPVDYIKVDGSLISNALQNKNTSIIIESIVGFAKKMQIKTVAEFVSSVELLEYVKELGFDYAQGYYFSEPRPYIGEI